MGKPNLSKTYLAKALQPIHVGAGGYQVERIDNKIIRDEKNVPVIPGTALSGAARSYMAMDFGISCGGRNGCGQDDCVVCMTFGYSKDQGTVKARQGMVQLYDAKLLFYPIATMFGPVWITSRSRLTSMIEEIDFTADHQFNKLEIQENSYVVLGTDEKFPSQLNLGWLIFHRDDKSLKKPESLIKNVSELSKKLQLESLISRRLICLNDRMFELIVDETLEKRTSVAIDPATNTADDGALFTYEAVPQTSYFYFTVTYNNPSGFYTRAQIQETLDKCKSLEEENDQKSFQCTPYCTAYPLDQQAWDYTECLSKWINDAFRYFKFLGVGGMTTRGFGRLEIREVEPCQD